jgi:DNA-directed RNA polymerase, subunit E''''
MSKRASYGLKACVNCKMLVNKKEKICPNCKSQNFSDDWSGLFIVFKPEESQVASLLGIKKPGMYAIKVK